MYKLVVLFVCLWRRVLIELEISKFRFGISLFVLLIESIGILGLRFSVEVQEWVKVGKTEFS